MRATLLFLLTLFSFQVLVNSTRVPVQNGSLELFKISKVEQFYMHHTKYLKDTILMISKESVTSDAIRKLNIQEQRSINYLLLKNDTLYFNYQTKVVGKPYKILTTTAPMGENSRTVYSYSRLPWLVKT